MGGEYHKKINKGLNGELRRIEAARAVLKRKKLDFFDHIRSEDDLRNYQAVLGLWQNEKFQAEIEQAVLAELAPDPGGIRRFLADFEVQIEDLDARWLLASYWQATGARIVIFDPFIREYQDTYTKDLLQRLESMQEILDVDLVTRRCLSMWQHVAERELVDSALASQRTGLRQDIANYRFQHQGDDYTSSQITTMILREEQDRKSRRKAWNGLVQLSLGMMPKIRKLLLQTNTYWQERGYANAVAPRLQTLGVSEDIVRQIIASIEAATRSATQSLLKEYEALLGHRIAPWDWRFAASQLPHSFEQSFKNMDATGCLKETYMALGIDVEHLPIQFAGSSTVHGISYNAVRVPHDIILSHGAIIGAREYSNLLHVLGEACYFAHIDSDLAYVFRRYAPKLLGEGFARLSSWLLWEYNWLEEFTNLSPEQIVEFSQQMKNYELLKLRYYCGFALSEMDAYHALADDPEADLEWLFEQHKESFLLMSSHEPSVWAAHPWLIDPQGIPLFTSYVLGLAIAASFIETFHENGESLFSESFGELFQSNLVQQGASSSWLERLEQQTARILTPFAVSWSQV